VNAVLPTAHSALWSWRQEAMGSNLTLKLS